MNLCEFLEVFVRLLVTVLSSGSWNEKWETFNFFSLTTCNLECFLGVKRVNFDSFLSSLSISFSRSSKLFSFSKLDSVVCCDVGCELLFADADETGRSVSSCSWITGEFRIFSKSSAAFSCGWNDSSAKSMSFHCWYILPELAYDSTCFSGTSFLLSLRCSTVLIAGSGGGACSSCRFLANWIRFEYAALLASNVSKLYDR